ncbi:MAG: glycoside hydrolase family 52 protein [Opitutus sp.]|nr:glycoside hydrolase family 52 protein [Opitutus sp.]
MTSAPSAAPLTSHAPFAAGADFAFGPGAPAEIKNGATSASFDFWVGCRHAPNTPWGLLPFYRADAGRPEPLVKGRYGRFLGWSGDKWMIGPLVFKLCTPFDPAPAVADDERFLHAPVLCGYLEYDNTHSDDHVELIFGLGGAFQPLDADGAAGFAHASGFAIATPAVESARLCRDLSAIGAGPEPAGLIHFAVAPRTKDVRPLVVAFHHSAYHYATLFPTLGAAVSYGLAEHARYLTISEARDAEFMRSPLLLAARTTAANEIRQWLASTARKVGEAPLDLAPMRALHAAVVNAGRA